MKTHSFEFKNRPRAILFEDEEAIRIQTAENFRDLGIHVDAYKDPDEATNALMTSRYDAGFFDINDPNGDPVGIELTRIFQQRNTSGHAYIVSGHPLFKKQAEQMGVRFIAKPFRRAVRETISERLHDERLHYECLKRRSSQNYRIFNIDAVIEWIDDLACSLSFYHKRLGWMVIHLPLKDIPSDGVMVGDVVRAGLVLDHRGVVSGFRLTLGAVRRRRPNTPGSDEDLALSPTNVNFNDPNDVETYRRKLKAFFGTEERI